MANQKSQKYQYPKKQPKPAVSSEQAIQAKLQTLSSQLHGGFLVNALKTLAQLLPLAPQDPLLLQTHAQVLLALEHFDEAAALPLQSIETVYAYYKLGYFEEAMQTLEAVKERDGDSRELRLLEAQIHYKSEDYQEAAALFHDLILTAEPDTPEYTDIEHNLAASERFLAHQQELTASSTSHSTSLAAILEDQPVGYLVASQYPSSAAAGTSATKAVSTGRSMKRSGKASKLPPKIAAMAPEDRPTIDEERWLPKQQRTDYVDPRKSREEEKRRKQKEKLSTQGSSAQNAVQSQNTGGSGGASRKKGKGKKH